MTESKPNGESARTDEAVSPYEETFPSSTQTEDRVCWVCEGWTAYRQCKIICQRCGFMRDCSDP